MLLQHDSIVLLDMDGTITEPRKKIEVPMLKVLQELSNYVNVGIISGSPKEFMFEQLPNIEKFIPDIIILASNGLNVLTYNDGWVEHSNQKVETYGYNRSEIISSILAVQIEVMKKHPQIDYSPNFITERPYGFNWSLCGRGSSHREFFVKLDKEHKIRDTFKEILMKSLLTKELIGNPVSIVKGGETGFDIILNESDKSQCLDTEIGELNCYFIGDACEEGENDYEIYTKLEEKKKGFQQFSYKTKPFAYKTKGPKDTLRILNNLIYFFKDE